MTDSVAAVICTIFAALFLLFSGMVAWATWKLVDFFTDKVIHQIECKHPNLDEKRWIENDGTCMVRHSCPDCGFFDCGHVYANPETRLQSDEK